MVNFFNRFFDSNASAIKRLKAVVDQINAQEERAKKLEDQDFPKETAKLQKQLKNDPRQLDEVLPWAFALVREAARRVLGERHYDVQLMAGVILHQGKIAEQKTGEGKTLSATAPLYLNALLGKGAHLVTVNDYLARRDAGWMGMVFDFLGLTTAAMISEKSYLYDKNYLDKQVTDWRLQHLKEITRKEAYQADVTYGINSEFGFDYLRDNMNMSRAEMVQRGFYYAIVDEVDSVLIDEARTPHIISAPYGESIDQYYKYAQVVSRLMAESDYTIDEKMRTVNLTEHGIEKIEKILGVKNVYESDYDSLFHIEAALKARTLFKLNRDYIIRNNEIVIVDEFTGRLLEGRRFSEGIHQAIEAKENVAIKQESKTLATVSLQNYFRMYDKLAGMTGTAATEAEEFHKIYKLEVVIVPTNQPIVRQDQPDFIYKTVRGKFTAMVEEIMAANRQGRPILVGTTDIDKNEMLSSLLKKKGVKHEILNAKNHEREAAIISNAGRKNAVTIATNMAGRGVDIVLGGNPPNRYQTGVSASQYQKQKQQWQKDHDEVVRLGGLYVMGTERHEARRIDNQLRGRAGRQGDPGQTRFFISLEDDMLRIFGGEQIGKLMTFFNFPENQPIEHAMVSKAIEQAQVKVEGFNFDTRKHLLEFDDVLNKQREIVYSQRTRIMEIAEDKNESLSDFLDKQIEKLIEAQLAPLRMTPQINKDEAVTILENYFSLADKEKAQLSTLTYQQFETSFRQNLNQIFKDKQKRFGTELFDEAIKILYISTIDRYFTEHLTHIESLREGISLRGYAQLDPLNEYKKESFQIFNNMLSSIRNDFFRRLTHLEIQPSQINQIEPEKKEAVARHDQVSALNNTPGVLRTVEKPKSTKIGRNDPCPCGSGKKYKKCHLLIDNKI
ncbi:preprotein translocase subunit SecA [Candidatus Roizmanbacteria bacterium RIFOXYA1_FULL_41_12]|uniref:Protein translocase subunit SecA n=1 Tax=Candidatus Roizmanbacteria bacterium RIFOXYA1_FULL_41_12 TaxID=1802082 RepID=A0A1F7K960_9BACT|nr:MAG: preprotein translocase subunit SecA [Candidatus Roizmanbacteria bacterium RIFOXYA1_FULL_41_12]OGK66980.1 MAG: preprotein translocase subunit SecA [Candidatus Roizmanbacteria bacterium RIFOXYB1_FULL_41_27]OGK71999.1 MAG: preprotein translocase subunit SecA [Candidatus Roizmanbacteria bacterium RIFOXYC1_FULL_41_16]OGK75153.1 MAG: preprotein translocase subunit SecA [Candidatus Roizmanbacteria bacterium RIFOXYD1_FULL_41_24]